MLPDDLTKAPSPTRPHPPTHPPRLDQLFTDLFARETQLIDACPKASAYLAVAVLARGNIQLSDLRRNIDRLRPALTFVPWNRDGWKTGICAVPPVGLPHCLLALSNNCSITEAVRRVATRFGKLYRRRANLHHYLQHGMERADFAGAVENVEQLLLEYGDLDRRSMGA